MPEKPLLTMTVEQYNQCVDLYSDGLFRFLVKTVKDRDQAKDLVQETYARLWSKVDEVSFEKAKSYIFTAGYHGMVDMTRKLKRQQAYTAEALHTLRSSEQQQSSDLKAILDEALDRLPTAQKSVVLLRDYEGYSYEEIEEITGLNASQVKVYIYRARIALKEYLVKMEYVV
jgi:RNA polymerase sigma factor (sigma-70 family)